jgi:hypothetical protein
MKPKSADYHRGFEDGVAHGFALAAGQSERNRREAWNNGDPDKRRVIIATRDGSCPPMVIEDAHGTSSA